MEKIEELEKDMTPKLIGETWRKYPTETSMQKATYGLFECQYCKKEFECIVQSISSGNTKSCGCLCKGQPTHGLTYNKFYDTWRNMKNRCTNPSDIGYKNYGERGITVCAEWLDVSNFVAWAEVTHPNIEGYSLDRIDNNKGYSPDNCTWSSRTMQNINRRMQVTNTSGYNGISWNKKNSNWRAVIGIATKKVYIGSFPTVQEAVLARNNYIIENKLPHKLSILNTGLKI